MHYNNQPWMGFAEGMVVTPQCPLGIQKAIQIGDDDVGEPNFRFAMLGPCYIPNLDI